MPLTNWKPYTEHVQRGTDPSKDMIAGKYVNSQTVMIAAGPPVLDALVYNTLGTDMFAYPIGTVQSWTVGQNRAISQIFEVGSQRSYFISGRTVGSLGIGRVYYHGPSLLRALYAYAGDWQYPAVFDTLMGGNQAGSLISTLTSTGIVNQHNTKLDPGFGNVWMNLASDLFSQPIGLLMYWADSNETIVSAVYFENCYVPNLNVSGDANGLIIQESCSLMFERMRPIATATSVLMTQINS